MREGKGGRTDFGQGGGSKKQISILGKEDCYVLWHENKIITSCTKLQKGKMISNLGGKKKMGWK